MARAIADLLQDDTKRRAFGAAGRERARAAFNADRMVEETAAVYAEVVARIGSGPRQRRRTRDHVIGVDDSPVDDRGGHRSP